ncbi:type 2A protein serine/threonine phosphatase 55kDa B regulatory subunit-like [Oryza sativa Japonica Group]|uniref:Serine/threonine-protein phosphatase 2A 55 kDa regulatory subunit B n=1 Tax=Oryza sativa subsp. japonica TaxID=39947 RepID=Q5ZAG2_ORYSJ|nr:type 2A protein serine/threonine phosphatase 55kDa B regulatory subunit-like [Oryza sativa Japonica Group]BAD53433.1 type 2A protein serine/threonine phosphatase 55kDa B regulatory subunit-like [Oryza sativa Japonica Group]
MNGEAVVPEPAAAASSPAQASPSPPEWRFSQVFGERSAGEEVQDVDIISAIEFNKSGQHLATGDRGGRVVLFERTDAKDNACRKEAEKVDYSVSRHPEFRYKTEFQSHEPESLEIEEKINKIKWCQTANGALFLLSTNDKTIKFWKVQEKKVKKVSEMNLSPSNASANGRPAGSNASEVITSAEFHPTHCNTLAYSSSKGSIRLVDLRQSALCDTHSQVFEQHEAPGSRSFFTEIIASISDIKFSKDGRHILSRDYMTLKLWDINMNSGPVATFQVHEYLRPKLCDLYENDSIFDKFECCQSGDGLRVATGSYSNIFRVFGCGTGSNEATTLEATRNPTRRQLQNPTRPARSLSTLTRVVRRGAESTGIEANGNSYDLSTKLLHLAWHPSENLIACAAANSLYMYYA